MRVQSLVAGLPGAVMIWLSLGALSGCSSLQEYFPPAIPSLPNTEAVNRALQLCALTHGEEPFHLRMAISPPAHPGPTGSLAPDVAGMQAEIELWWLNPITYRTEIRSARFRQTRIVNGAAVEEQNTGPFYPRWIQNFVDALFEPVPDADKLRVEPGAIPVSQESHACISSGAHDETAMAEICFQGQQPLLASGISFNRYVAFDNYAAFGRQLIPRTLINDLPANTLLRGQILLLEPLPQSAYPLLKPTYPTPLSQQIRTRLVSRAEAEAMLLTLPSGTGEGGSPFPGSGLKQLTSFPSETGRGASTADPESDPVTVYVRTDITGRVREAYTDRNDIYNQHQRAVLRAMQLRFRPLVVNGALVQMEAPVAIR